MCADLVLMPPLLLLLVVVVAAAAAAAAAAAVAAVVVLVLPLALSQLIAEPLVAVCFLQCSLCSLLPCATISFR